MSTPSESPRSTPIDGWFPTLIAALVGLAGSAPSWGPYLLRLLSSRHDNAVADATAHESNRVRFETAQQARIESLVAQIDKRESIMLKLTEEAAAAKAELATLKAGMSQQLGRIESQGNGVRKALEIANAALVEKVTRLEEAQAAALLRSQAAAPPAGA